MKKISIFILFIMTVVLMGCDPVYPPFIESGFDSPVKVIYEYDSGKEEEWELQPDSAVWEGRNAKRIAKISLYQDEEFLFNITKEDMNYLRKLLEKGDKEITWFIDGHGIKLFSYDKKLIGEIKK